MGTSTRWPGPKGGAWIAPNRRLGELDRQASESTRNENNPKTEDQCAVNDQSTAEIQAAIIAKQCWEALAQTLCDDPDAYGLRDAALATGGRLVRVLAELVSTGPTALGPLSGDTPDARLVTFVQRFTDRVVGAGSSPVYAAARRAAVDCTDKILQDPRIHSAVTEGDPASKLRLSGDLLCLIYRLFFARLVSRFIQAAIAAKINLLMPWWQAVDPAGKLSEWLTANIMAVLPNPCEVKQDRGDDGISLADLARDLLEETVKRALGLPMDTSGAT